MERRGDVRRDHLHEPPEVFREDLRPGAYIVSTATSVWPATSGTLRQVASGGAASAARAPRSSEASELTMACRFEATHRSGSHRIPSSACAGSAPPGQTRRPQPDDRRLRPRGTTRPTRRARCSESGWSRARARRRCEPLPSRNPREADEREDFTRRAHAGTDRRRDLGSGAGCPCRDRLICCSTSTRPGSSTSAIHDLRSES